MSPRRRRLFAALGVAAAALLLGRLAAMVYVDRAWYVALGAGEVWRAKAVNTVLLRGSAWLVGALFIFANLLVVRRSVLKLVVPRRVANIEIDAEVSGRSLLTAAALTAAGVSALLTLTLDDWTTLALARVARPFGEQEFLLEHDLATWTAWLPLERTWYGWAQATLFASSCLVVALYALTPGLRWERGALRTATYVRRHLAVLGALLLLLLAWGYGIERQLTLVNDTVAGTDVAPGALTGLLVLSILTAATAILILWAGYVGQTRIAFAGVTLVIVAAIGLQHILPATLRWLRQQPEDADKIGWRPGSTRSQFTRRAYDVQDLARAPRADSTTGFTDPAQLAGRVSLWSEAAIRAAVELGGWRREVVGGVGWQRSADGLVAVAAAREPATDSVLDSPAGWVVAEVEASRAALDAAAAVPPLRTRSLPSVLVHPAAVGYQIVPAPSIGVAAPPLGTGWRRLAAALAVQNPQLFLDGPALAGARMVHWRDVAERVQRLAPIFQQGGPAVPVLAGDSLYWAVHLYTSSRTYPLSVPLRVGQTTTKYFQHAALALVNAHTGQVSFVPVERPDPLAAAWMDRFPSLFAEAPPVPRELLAHLPPPIAGVRAQLLGLILTGGVTTSDREPPLPVRLPQPWGPDSTGTAVGWEVPFLPAADSSPPSYAIPLVGEADDRPRALVVTSGGLVPRTVVIPLDSTGPRWTTLIERLRAGAAAGGATGGATGGTARPGAGAGPVIAGPLQALPVEVGVIFLQPLYAWRGDGPPELAQVALADADTVRRAPTLEALLVSPDSSAGRDAERSADPARLYARMRDALRRGDWQAFGEAFEALGRALGAPVVRP